MNQLRLLWELQIQDEELNHLLGKLNKAKKADGIASLELRLQQIGYDISNAKTKVDVNNEKIRRHSKKLDEFSFKAKEVEEKLYSGDITDLNQIQHMNKEIKHLKELNEELESEILELMEENEFLNNDLAGLEDNYNKCMQEFDIAKDTHSQNIQELTDIINKKEELKTNSLGQIDSELLKKYETLKASKGKAIAKISEDKCTGCHMNIPLTTVSKLKKNDDIYYCDNCDRMLLYIREH